MSHQAQICLIKHLGHYPHSGEKSKYFMDENHGKSN